MGDAPARQSEKPKETGSPVLTRVEDQPTSKDVPTPVGEKSGINSGATADVDLNQWNKDARVQMGLLDERVNYGKPMGADVERDYRKLIDTFEPKDREQTSDERVAAIVGRTRMMTFFDAAGDRAKFADMAVDTASKYPSAFTDRNFSKMCANNDMQENPQFKKILDSDSTNRDRFDQAAPLKRGEQARVDARIDEMQGFDVKMLGDRSEAFKDYWNLIDEHEKPGSTKADRQIASAARMRVIHHMNDGRESPSAILDVMKDSMEKYPRLTNINQFVAIAAEAGATSDPAWMESFRNVGGPERKFYGYKPEK